MKYDKTDTRYRSHRQGQHLLTAK